MAAEKSFPALTEKNLKLAISMHPDPVSIPALMAGFGVGEKSPHRAEALRMIQGLKDEGFCRTDKGGRLIATRPMSDLVVAKLVKRTPKGAILEIKNLPEALPFSVSVSRTEIKKFSSRLKLREGSQLAVQLNRCGGTELKASIIDTFAHKRVPKISGKFKAASTGGQPVLIALGRSIKTDFPTYSKATSSIDLKYSYRAAIPHDLDPMQPRLELLNRVEDFDTGVPIAYIVANKNGISTYHPKTIETEARKGTKRDFIRNGRRDLSREKIRVIDPSYAADHDDGILIERDPYGFRTLVVISDVPFYVRSGTELDRDAQSRGLTHYFTDKTFHMLPQSIVKKASLTQGDEKPVIYVEQFYDHDGNRIGEPEIGPGFIASQIQHTYGEFEDMIIAKNSDIEAYDRLGEILISKMRHEKGVVFDAEGLDSRNLFSQSLVASMMNEANVSLAEFCSAHNEEFLRRAHTASENPYAYQELREVLEKWGYDMPFSIDYLTVQHLKSLISEAEHRNEKAMVEGFIRTTVLEKATYTPFERGHFVLNVPEYTHGTSPIRRYADILTLRAVHRISGTLDVPDRHCQLDGDLSVLAHDMNLAEMRSRNAQHDYQKFHLIQDLARHQTTRASVLNINPMEVEIILPKFGLKKSLSHAALPTDWRVAANAKSLIFQESVHVPKGANVMLRIGDVFPSKAEWTIDSMEPRLGRTQIGPPARKAADFQGNMPQRSFA